MINCLLTVAQCTLITNHSAAENGIFQQMICIRVIQFFSWNEKQIPKKLEEAKDNSGIPLEGAGGCQGGQGRAQELPELCWREQSCAEPCVQRGSAASSAAVGRENKPCAVASHLAGCKTQHQL